MSIGKIFGIFDISGSGLSAQRKNLEVRAENIANSESIDKETGEPYKSKEIRFAALPKGHGFKNLFANSKLRLLKNSQHHLDGNEDTTSSTEKSGGVEADIYEDENQKTKLIYAPDHPNANEDGYIEVADIDSIGEMVQLMSAARAYEANATVINAAKDMFKRALDI
jgi:flagellar basal-body rod protein FlgC